MSTADDTLRADLDELANRAPAVLDRLAQLPQVMVHGDASPQNLLIARAGPDTFVAIDWSPGGLEPAGEDLAQLQLGLAHAGELELEQLAVLRPVLVNAFSNGLRAEGIDCREEDIAYAMAGGLLFRSAFTSLPLDRLQEPITEELADLFANRLTLTRHLTDHCLSGLPAHP
jgi:aminoglycoside phosphotransferase (APT) family kinase protein